MRTQINEYEKLDDNIQPFQQMFLSDPLGVVLRKRDTNDQHICFEIISSDDGFWMPGHGEMSTAWLNEFIALLTAARNWCEENALPEINQCPHVPNHIFGWRFKQDNDC